MKKYFYWALIAFSALMSFTFIAEGAYLSTFVLCLSTLVLLPNTIAFAEKKLNKPLAVWQPPVVWFVVFLFAFAFLPKSVLDRLEANSLKREKERTEQTRQEQEAQAKEEIKRKVQEESATKKLDKNETPKTNKMDTYNENGEVSGSKDMPKMQPQYGGVILHKSQFGEKWPLAVEWGEITCESMSIFFYANNNKYAVNGTSKSEVGKNFVRGNLIKEIDEIWIDDPQYKGIESMKGTKISIGPIISAGLELCGK